MAVTVHTHESAGGEGDILAYDRFKTWAEVSLDGSLGALGTASLTFNAWMVMPMVHATISHITWVGHATDAADPDSPRLKLYNRNTSTSGTYDVDYYYLGAS